MPKDQSDGEQTTFSEDELSYVNQEPAPTLLVWAVRGICAALIVALIGYFVYVWGQPAGTLRFDLRAITERIEQRDERWVVPIVVTNKGDVSVHTLRIFAAAPSLDNEQELVIDLLGPGEAVTVEFWLDEDPRDDAIGLRVGSYLLP